MQKSAAYTRVFTVVDLVEIFQVSQIEVLPVNADMIWQATQRDPVLSRVMENTKQGWPTVSEKELEPFQRRKDGWLPYVGFTSNNPSQAPGTTVS